MTQDYLIDRLQKHTDPVITRRGLSDIMNALEEELFIALPWALELPEDQQDDLIEYLFRKTNAGKLCRPN